MTPTTSPVKPVSLALATVLGIAAVIAGLVVGGSVNMGIILGGCAILPPPAGVDINKIETINAHIHEYSFVQLMNPFIAHAAGTLVGAFVAAVIAATARTRIVAASIIGVLSLAGGTMAVLMIPKAPMWFNTLDLTIAYIPMAWIGLRLGALVRAPRTF